LQTIAAIRFPSPLPQLDREYDYLVRDGLHLDIGALVEVPFGHGKRPKQGVVVELKNISSHDGKLTEISQIVSPFQQISREVLVLCGQVALRQAGTVGELLATALPKRFIRVEKSFESTEDSVQHLHELNSILNSALETENRMYFTPRLLAGTDNIPSWAIDFALACSAELAIGRSSLVVLPDYREMRHFEMALELLKLGDFSHRHASSDTGSDAYRNHLLALRDVGINYGTRSACFAPAKNLGLIMLWDDGDESHLEQSSPYWCSREVLLQRHENENTKLVLASHSPSSECLRLIEIGYLKKLVVDGNFPLVRITENFTRLDDETFGLVSKIVSQNRPVLVQVNNLGFASAVACGNCKEIRICPNCASSIWIDPLGILRCRSCRHAQELTPCLCGGLTTKAIRIGSSAVADQLRKSFPSTTIVESNGENPIVSISSGGVLVVSTPGAEPDVDCGYDLILIADAAQMIGAPRLRALERAVAVWANAISLASEKSLVIFVGLSGALSEQIKTLNFYRIVELDYIDRMGLGLPPATRVASISSSNHVDHGKLVNELEQTTIFPRLRVLPSKDELTIVLDYQYADGAELANQVVKITRLLSVKSKHKKPGERVFRINMDDYKVI